VRWIEMPLRRLFSTVTGGSWGNDPEDGGSLLPCVRGTDFDYAHLRTDLSRAPVRGFGPADVGSRSAKRGDIVIEKSGGGEQQPVGRAVLHDLDVTIVPTNFAGRLRVVREADPRFVCYLLASLYSDGRTRAAIKQTTGIQNLDLDAFLAYRILSPTMAEQHSIADYLDAETGRIDALIEKKRRMLELLADRFWSSVDTILDAVGGPMVKLTHSATSWCDGPFGSSLTSTDYADAGARVVRLGNIGRGVFKNESKAYISDDYFGELMRHEVKVGDLLVAGLGDAKNPLGRACVAPSLGAAIVKADCFRFRLQEASLLPSFAAWYLSSSQGTGATGELATGSTRSRANLGVMANIRLPRPDIEQQSLAVGRIEHESDQLGQLQEGLSRQLRLLIEHRQALITSAITGQLPIPGLAA
jgi:type I restriction enzyme S subunit